MKPGWPSGQGAGLEIQWPLGGRMGSNPIPGARSPGSNPFRFFHDRRLEWYRRIIAGFSANGEVTLRFLNHLKSQPALYSFFSVDLINHFNSLGLKYIVQPSSRG